jgi:outer membrane protein OmpA-like peptidoglycan-associated protein
MAESLFASLLHSLDKSSISQIAGSLNESEQSVSRGMEASMASVLGVMASKADDQGALRHTLDLAPENWGETSWTKLASGLSGSASPWLTRGKQLLGGLFGQNEGAVANAVARESGVGAGTATTMLALAAPIVLRFIGRRVIAEGLSMRALGALLQKESGAIRSALPAGLSDLLWQQREAAAATASPVIAQSVQPETRSAAWLGILGLSALALGGLWLWSHYRRPAEIRTTTVGQANRMADEAMRTGEAARRKLPGNVDLNQPVTGVESEFLGVINGTRSGLRSTWIDFDRLKFDTGSATLRPESSIQLDRIAAIMKAHPNTTVTIAGFTDSVGDADKNLQLSRERAKSVKSALTARGVSSTRLMTEGFGETPAIADNSTSDGRARNRRVAIQVAHR